ncbi:MAG: PepSY domain-containing protein [Solirubrobacteraceae bacterium]
MTLTPEQAQAAVRAVIPDGWAATTNPEISDDGSYAVRVCLTAEPDALIFDWPRCSIDAETGDIKWTHVLGGHETTSPFDRESTVN